MVEVERKRKDRKMNRKVKYAGFYTCNMQAVRVTPFFDTAQEAADYGDKNGKDYDVIRPVANWKELS